MARTLGVTPLLAVDAVALDLETTGLDPRSACIVQIGAVALGGGEVKETPTFSMLVDPGIPIPATATAIHGISAADVRGAAGPAGALRAFLEFLSGRPLVGHGLGFDLAVLAAEARRLGEEPPHAPFLDTRLLAEVAVPALPEYTLETLAERLGVKLGPRHTAIGDAESTARIFCALIPRLRVRGIRTWGEASAACRNLPTDPNAAVSGWAEIGRPSPAVMGAGLARIDSYPYRHRVADVMTSPPCLLKEGSSLHDATRAMAAHRVSSLFVGDSKRLGILTERDVLREVASSGSAALAKPAANAASFPLQCVAADDFIYRAIGRMARLQVRHLGVTGAQGTLVGALSARDLLRMRASDAVRLGDAIEMAEDVPALAGAWAPLPLVVGALLEEDVGAVDVAAVIGREIGAATRRAAELGEASLRAGGEAPPCDYAVLVLGSAGRGESLLALDQDNAIVFRSGDPGGPEDRYFAKFGQRIADTLDAIGVPFCKGGVMAREPAWRGSVATWRERIAHWLTQSSPQDLLSVDIFFDAYAVHGDARLADAILAEARTAASRAPEFIKLLAAATPRPPSALGLVGGFRTEEGRIDLKRAALLAIVSSARVLALRRGIDARSTQARLQAIEALQKGGEADLAAAREGHATILAAILRQQVRDIETGIPPSNRVAVAELSRREKEALKTALRFVPSLDDLLRDLLF